MAAFHVLVAIDSGMWCAGPAVDSLLWKIVLECFRLPAVASSLMQSSPPSPPFSPATKVARRMAGKTSGTTKDSSATTDSETRDIDRFVDLFDRTTVTTMPKQMSTEFALLLVAHPSVKHLSSTTLSKLMLGTGSKNLQILFKFHTAFEEHVDWIRQHHVKLEAKDESLMCEVLTRLEWVLGKDPSRPRWDFGMAFGIGGRADSNDLTESALLSKLSETRTLIIQRYQTLTGSTSANSGKDSDDSYEYPSSEDDEH